MKRTALLLALAATAALVAAGCGAEPTACSSCVDGGARVDGGSLGDGGTKTDAATCPGEAERIEGECRCLPGYFGDDCRGSCGLGQILVDGNCMPGCGPLSCAGHGRCSVRDGLVSCDCDSGWGGPYCSHCEPGLFEDDGSCVDLCADVTCSGRGICDAYSGRPVCLCDQGYIGPACADCAPSYRRDGQTCMPVCQPESCSGHGWCDAATGEPVCSCRGGYVGATCADCPFAHADVGDACVPLCELKDCANASCDASTGNAVCTCYDTYQGAACQSCAAGYDDLGGGVCGSPAVALASAGYHTCALLANGTARCWGDQRSGRLGYPGSDGVGCEAEPVYAAGALDLPGTLSQLALGSAHSCALLTSGDVYCFGSGSSGQLGYGSTDTIGDDEPIDAGGPVSLGGKAVYIAAGSLSSCAVLSGGDVRCWGDQSGTLPSMGDPIDVGGPAVEVARGSGSSCVRRADGKVRCWGSNYAGVLGAGVSTGTIDAASAKDLDLPASASQIVLGDWHACALLVDGKLYCWGTNTNGELGYGHTRPLGKEQTPREIGPVDVGGSVVRVVAADKQTCAVLEGGGLRCWGSATSGKLGYPEIDEAIGDDETPASVGSIPIGEPVRDVAIGDRHTCALLASGAVRCWGNRSGTCVLGASGAGIGRETRDPTTAADVALFFAK
jgi:alpha-tubulin suppressor-like RCC1 family protein